MYFGRGVGVEFDILAVLMNERFGGAKKWRFSC